MPDPVPVPSALIDARELSRLLSVSLPTIWRMRNAGRLPEPIRLTSQCLRWRRCDVDAWLASGCPTPDTKREVPNGR